MSAGCTVVLVFMLYCSLVLRGAADDEIRVGVVLDSRTAEGQEQEIAMKMAAQDCNSTGLRLHLNVTNVSYKTDLLKAASTAETLIKVWGARALIGAGTLLQVAYMADAAKYYRVPFLSLSSPVSSMEFHQNTSLVDMSIPSSAQVQFLADFIKSYNWGRVIVIYEEDYYVSSVLVARFSSLLEAAGSLIDRHVVLPPLDAIEDPKDEARKQLEAVKNRLCGVYIILRSSKTLAKHLFSEAKNMGLMDKGYVWIVGDDLSTFSPAFVSSNMQGVIGIKAYFKKTTKLHQKFLSEFREHASDYLKTSDIFYDDFTPGYSILRAWDAVHIVASAANATRMKNTPILQGILSSNFEGLSGQIKFGKHGDLKLENGSTVFHVINFVGRSYKEIGFWSYGQGFYKDELDMEHGRTTSNLTAVIWPGALQGRAPGGWGRPKILLPSHTFFEKFLHVTKLSDGRLNTSSGFCIAVFKKALEMLPYSLEVDYYVSNKTMYDDDINDIALEKYHAAVGDFTILADRMEKVTFTEAYMSSGIAMMVPLRRARTWMFWRPFQRDVWVVIVVTSLYTAVVLWCLQRRPQVQLQPDTRPYYTQFAHTVWQIISTFFYQFGTVRSSFARMVLIPWLFVLFVLLASYNANLSAILTTEKLNPIVPVQTHIGCDGDSFVVRYLHDVLGFSKDDITNMSSPNNYTDAFSNQEITVAFLEIPYLRLFLSEHDNYTVYGETFRLGGLGFAFQKGSPLANDFSVAILRMQEDGTLKKLEEEWFKFTLSNCPKPEDLRNRSVGLGMDDFLWLFVFTLGSSTIILLIYIARSRPYIPILYQYFRTHLSIRFDWSRLVGFARRLSNMFARGGRSRNIVPPNLDEVTNMYARSTEIKTWNASGH